MLNLNLKNSQSVVITNKHEVFANTPFAESDFSLTMKPISQVKYSEIQRKNTQIAKGSAIVNETGVVGDLFCWSVTGWDGVADENDADIPCNAEAKRNIVANAYPLADAAVAACYTETRNLCVANKEAEKN